MKEILSIFSEGQVCAASAGLSLSLCLCCLLDRFTATTARRPASSTSASRTAWSGTAARRPLTSRTRLWTSSTSPSTTPASTAACSTECSATNTTSSPPSSAKRCTSPSRAKVRTPSLRAAFLRGFDSLESL